MSKTIAKELAKTIHQKRGQLEAIREEVEDLLDYLEVLESRARDEKTPRLTHTQVKKRFDLK